MNITFVVIVTLEAKIFEAKYATPIFSRGPIGHSTKKLGAQFTAKSARGPICLEPRILQCYMWVGWMGWDGMGLGWMRWLS